MTTQLQVLNASRPGNSLALWLAIYQPDIFVTYLKKVAAGKKAAKVQTAMAGLGDDGDDDDVIDVDVDSDDTDTDTDTDTEDLDTSGVLEPLGASDLETLTLDGDDLSAIDPQLVTPQTSSGGQVVASASSATTSSGTTVGSIADSLGTTVLGAVAAVGSALTTPQAISSLAATASAYYNQQNTAQALQNAALVGAQAARAASGLTAAPITYVTDPVTGSQTPALASTAANGSVSYTPLTQAQLTQLTPSGLSSFLAKYGVWLAAGAAALVVAALFARAGSTQDDLA